MTPRQLERKAKQLLYRQKLADTIESLEDSIKTYMQVEEKEKVLTKNFAISLDDGKILVKLRPNVDPRQLSMRF